jgi:anti-sigma regulatory factor (Ser/Thr protein kinase)
MLVATESRIPAPAVPVAAAGPAAPAEAAWTTLSRALAVTADPRAPVPPTQRGTQALPCTAVAVPLARAWLRRLATSWCLEPDLVERLELIATELLTNAVQHTTSAMVWQRLECRGAELIGVAVADQGPRGRAPWCVRAADCAATHGRGLHMVRLMSTCCGSQPLGHGSLVWAVAANTDNPEVDDELLPRSWP